MKNTALMELVEWLNVQQESEYNTAVIGMANMLMDMEKKQIKKAWEAGMYAGINSQTELVFDNPESYYNEVYKIK